MKEKKGGWVVAVLKAEPQSVVHLLYANENESSVMFYTDLNALSEEYSNRFFITHVLNKPSASWDGKTGWLTDAMINEWLEAKEVVDAEYFICGPEPMMEIAKQALEGRSIDKKTISY